MALPRLSRFGSAGDDIGTDDVTTPEGELGLPQPLPVPKVPDDYYDEEVHAPVPQLPAHDIQLPEEPEYVSVRQRNWDGQQYTELDQGLRALVPTGCDRPTYCSPYDSVVKLLSALPRDRAEQANLYATYQNNGWMGRHEVIKRLELGIQPNVVDKAIMDDAPILDALKGIPDPAQQVGQTNGGSSNGAPPPPAPGPGRGNLKAPGDNMGGKQPPNGKPGVGV